MGYRMPKPPLMTKEQEERWDKMEDRYYKFMSIGMFIVYVLFMVLIGIIIYAKTLK